MKVTAIFVSLLISILGLLTVGVASAEEGSGQDFVIHLDQFLVEGPGVGEPGWSDDFDDGDLGRWSCMSGTCQEIPGTSYVRLESPGNVIDYAGLPGVSYEESSLFSWIIPESYASADGWFQGVAVFAAELPRTNESISLGLIYGPFDLDGHGTMVYEQVAVFVENTSPVISSIFGNPVVGLQVQQGRGVFDENWNLLSYSDWDSEPLIVPDVLGKVILSIRYEDAQDGRVYHAGYSITESPEVVEPFSPIPSNLYLSDTPGSWGIGAHVDFLNFEIDIKPGSDPNCFNLNGHGVIPVAINGSADLDVYDVDVDTLLLSGLQTRVRGNKGPLCSIRDWNDDGFVDLVCHFEDDPASWTGGDSYATVTGYLIDGTTFVGTDSMCIVP